MKGNESVVQLIAKCRYESDVDEQILLLSTINEKIPNEHRVHLPSLLTNDYVAKALDIIEERIFFR